MEPDIKARLEAILADVRRLRANLYPADWTADPWWKNRAGLAEPAQRLKARL